MELHVIVDLYIYIYIYIYIYMYIEALFYLPPVA